MPERFEIKTKYHGLPKGLVEANVKCVIRGSEIEFEMEVGIEGLRELALDIWFHSSKYSDHADGSESSFYSFTKFLDIYWPDGREERLSDFAQNFDRVPEGVSCRHKSCLLHVHHPCEVCGRIAGQGEVMLRNQIA